MSYIAYSIHERGSSFFPAFGKMIQCVAYVHSFDRNGKHNFTNRSCLVRAHSSTRKVRQCRCNLSSSLRAEAKKKAKIATVCEWVDHPKASGLWSDNKIAPWVIIYHKREDVHIEIKRILWKWPDLLLVLRMFQFERRFPRVQPVLRPGSSSI